MTVLEEARSLFAAGRQAEAVARVTDAAARDDAEALVALANWRMFALYGPRDLAATHRHLERAEALGDVEGARLRAHLLASGTGVPPDPEGARAILRRIAPSDPYAAFQLQFLPRMKSGPDSRERLRDDPSIELVRGMLSPEECRFLTTLAEPRLQPSFVIDPATSRRIPDPMRTSMGMNFDPTLEDLCVNAINRRIATATGTSVASGEPLHILRYNPGEEYRPHLDALPGVDNQREWTALVYLNEDYEGGATAFPMLGIEVKGRQGDMLVFRNVDGAGRGDQRTRHAGLPVTGGVKWLATRWIRRRSYDPLADLAPRPGH